MKMMLALLGFFLLMSGCTTPYQPLGLTGGYSEMAYNKNTYSVVFNANGYTSFEAAERNILRRCAELTIKEGYKYFVITDRNTPLFINMGAGGLITSNIANSVIKVQIKMLQDGDLYPQTYDAVVMLSNFQNAS